MTDAAVATGSVVADRYVVGRLLGSGTMGTVRAAFDLELCADVAIKFVSTDELSREETVERFKREVRVAAGIKSEHVVRVLDDGSLPNGTPFMVMELLEGRGLDAERDLRGVIPAHEAVGYILPAIEVLAEAHAAGVVHRDIKPANLFLEDRGHARRCVKLLDFGVSKSRVALASRENAITKTGVIMGSPLYMAPEQLRSTRAVDARADIWSLGAILYELVTGHTAHVGDSLAEVCATLLRDAPRPITDVGCELPPGFAEVVMRCLEPHPERRYSNVAELGAALLPFAPGGAVHVERAKRALARVPAEGEVLERAPSSDAPVTIGIGSGTAREPSDAPSELGGFRMARVALAFTLVGLGIGTVFVVEVTKRLQEHGARPPPVTIATLPQVPAPAPAPAQEVPSAATSNVPTPAISSGTLDLRARPLGAEPKRSRHESRARKSSPKRAGIARPPAAASVGVPDFGGRR
jgi:eukaryotic-like serine/threonine-protein kinase